MKKSTKVLIISLIMLLVLLGIYKREPLSKAAQKFGEVVSEKYEDAKVKMEEKKAEREAKRAEKEAKRKLAEEKAYEELKRQEEANNPAPETILLNTEELIEERHFTSEELELISQQNGVVITADDNTRYVTVTSRDDNGEPVMRYLLIMDSVDGKYFRPMDDYVYSCACTKLFDSPSMVNAIVTAGEWEEYKRLGISSDGIYQLLTGDGRILFANGQYFRRYRENMPLTEEINIPAERVELEVKHLGQNPSLPNGCEITSLAMVLNYLGYDITKENLSDNYLPKAAVGEANFYEEFVGNPRDASSYGCYAGAIVNAANSFLASRGSEKKAVDYTGTDFATLLTKVKQGNPVILWATAYLNQDPGYTTEWWVDGEYLVWKANLHCVVLSGYDSNENTVIVQDPMRGTEEYDMELFIKRFKQFYSQAVIIE